MVCVPVSAAIGSNILPEIPGPEKVPPGGVPVRVTVEAVLQYLAASPLTLTVVVGYMPIDTTSVAVALVASVIVSV